MPTQLFLFGLPQIKTASTQTALRLNNPTLLLLYLAMKGDWVSRSELAFLFRPDDDEVTALKHIRLLLYRAKKLDWAETLEVDKRRARLILSHDVSAFKQALKAQNWLEASRLYSNPFLGDYSNAELVTYSAWIDLERSDLENNYKESLESYTRNLEAEHNFLGAAQVLGNLLKLDPSDEEIFRRYAKQLYLANERDKALQAYNTFSTLLKKEYDIEPLDETKALITSMRKGETLELSTAPIQETIGVTRAYKTFNNLPKQNTRFIGRKAELSELSKQLKNENCRLLTLVALGGAGKTRLALELARAERTAFNDGVCFVPLAALSSSQSFITTLAQGLELTLGPKQDPKEQVIQFLANKNLLLVLDNFEHILEASPIVKTLLEGTEKLKIIVTSRERLNIAGEWLFDLDGLEYPKIKTHNSSTNQSKENIESYDAIQFFINSAKRVAPKLELLDEDFKHVMQVAQKVEGLPLALELAASWARIMPIERIAQELEGGYELLENPQADVPDRQKSITSILNKTWQGLSEKKRQTLARFSIFQGGATLEAAEEVTGTHFTILLSLVNESLLKRIPPDRFDIHSLLKDFCSEQNFNTEEISKQHSEFYAQKLADWEPSIKAGQQLKTLTTIRKDSENVQKSWRFASQHLELPLLSQSITTLGYYYTLQSLIQTAVTEFSHGKTQLEQAKKEQTSVFVSLLTWLATFERLLGNITNAQALIAEAQKHHETTKLKAADHVRLICELSRLEAAQGHYDKSQKYFEDAIKILDGTPLPHLKADVFTGLASTMYYQGDIDKFESYQNKALILHREHAIDASLNASLINLGTLAYSKGQLNKAFNLFTEALELAREFSNIEREALILSNLGTLHLKQGQFVQANESFEQSLKLRKNINDKKGIAMVLTRLAQLHFEQTNYELSAGYFKETLAAFTDLQDQSNIAFTKSQYSRTLLALGKNEEALSLAQEALALAQQVKASIDTHSSLLSIALAKKELKAFAEALLISLHLHKENKGVNAEISENAATLSEEIKAEIPQESIQSIENDVANTTLESVITMLLNQDAT